MSLTVTLFKCIATHCSFCTCRKMHIQLECDKSQTTPSLIFIGENSDKEYVSMYILMSLCDSYIHMSLFVINSLVVIHGLR